VNTGSSKHGNSSCQLGGQYGESILSFTLIKETRARETQRASGSNQTIVGLKDCVFLAIELDVDEVAIAPLWD
jgi:hypothetical protein